ncbi:TraC family protein [Motilimonas eburnea]|uniref:TraC family protein n=1 Tax=Motilimonas eburnea TaxID=1737488 RepID=UPI001E3CB753|nr:TraC family protein [Motilimonas eburnea]MCE2571740.1 TraC family protein [Motilimonas eburnea]
MVMLSGFLERQNRTLDYDKVGSLMPVVDFIPQPKIFICEGGYIASTWVCQPSPGCTIKHKNTLTAMFKDEYPDDFCMQIQLVPLPDIRSILYGFSSIRGGRANQNDEEQADLLNELDYRYLKTCVDQAIHPESGMKAKNYEVWVSIKMPIAKLFPSDDEQLSFIKTRKSISAHLKNLNLSPMLMDDEDWLYRMQILLQRRPDALWRKDKVRASGSAPLSNQVLEKGNRIALEVEGIQVDRPDGRHEAYIKMLSVESYPKLMGFGFMYDIIADWKEGRWENAVLDNVIITQNIHFPNQSKMLSNFNAKKSFIINQAHGPTLKWSSKLRYQFEDFRAIEHEINEEKAKLTNSYLQFMVIGQTKESVTNSVEQLKSFANGQHLDLVEDHYLLAPLFANTMPMGIDPKAVETLERYEIFTSRALSFLCPYMGPWKGNTAYPVMTLFTREGQVFSMDLFETNGSYNCVVSATSGKGKSVFVGKLLDCYLGSGVNRHWDNMRLPKDKMKYFRDGGQAIVIDVGRSYENLCAQYKSSQYITFGQGCGLSLNPFSAFSSFTPMTTEETIRAAKISENQLDTDAGVSGASEIAVDKMMQSIMVLNMLKMMASESGNIDDYQSAVMLSIMTNLHAELGSKADVTEFARRCLAHEDKRVKDIGEQLQPFCEGGIYGDLFSTRFPAVDFSANLVCCELEELKGMPHLQTVVLMAIIQQAQNSFFQTAGTLKRKLFILDEAWEFLKVDEGGSNQANSNFFAKFLEAGWRRFRKTGAAGIVITQSLMDCYESPTGRAVVDNSPWKITLGQLPEAIEKLRTEKAYYGSETEFTLLHSLNTVAGQYAEMMVRHEQSSEVCRLILPKESLLVYSTKPSDRSRVKKFLDMGHSRLKAIELAYKEMAAEYRANGVGDDDSIIDERDKWKLQVLEEVYDNKANS